jgi:hypothetical protein
MQFIYKYANIWVWPVLVLVIHNFATLLGTYYSWLWFDSPMHFIGGMSIAFSTHHYLRQDANTKTTAFTYLVLIVGSAAMAAIGWELLEFTLDSLVGTSTQPSIRDTLKDLFIGTAAAAVIALGLAGFKQNKNP